MENPKFEQYEIHPLALAYPEMPQADFEGLKQSILADGLKDRVVTTGLQILDGRHRYKALCELASEGKIVVEKSLGVWQIRADIYERPRQIFQASIELGVRTEEQMKAFVTARNLHRRHLTPEQKRELVAGALLANPERSDRQIAVEVKVSPTTVGVVRRELEQRGDVSSLDTRRDTQGREQPATKPTKPQSVPQADPLQSFFGDNGEIQAHVPDKHAFLESLTTEEETKREAWDWRGYVKEKLRVASDALKDVIVNTPDGVAFGTLAFLQYVKSAEGATLEGLKALSFMPLREPMSEEEAVEFLQEDEETIEVPLCMDCKQEMPLDHIGVEIEDIEGDVTYLVNGVQAFHAGTEQEAYLCADCARKRNEEPTIPDVKCAGCKVEIPASLIDVVEKEHGDSARLKSGVMLTREEEGNLYYCNGCAAWRWKSLTEQKVLSSEESLGGYKVGECVGWREHGLDHREGDKVRYGTIVACGKAIWRGSTPQGDFQLRERFYFDIDFDAEEFDKGGIRRCERTQVFHVGVDMAESEELAVDTLRVEPHVINTMLGQVSLENHLQSPVWCESMQKAMQDWFDCMLDSEEDAAERRIENYVRSWTAPLTPEQSNQYAEAHSLLILCKGEKRRRAEQSEQQEEPAPMFAEIEDRGEGMLFGMAPAKRVDNSLEAMLM